MKKSIALLDYLFLLRPTLFYPIWTFFLAGYLGGMKLEKIGGSLIPSMSLIEVVIGLTGLMGSIFILNQIRDIETDRANNKLFLLANGIVPVKHAYWEAVFLVMIGLTIGFLADLRIGFGFLILTLLSGYAYNYPPTQWKDRPIMGIVTNGTGGLIIYCLGWITGGGREIVPLRVIPYTLAGAAVFLNTTLPDVEGDAKTGKITFGVRFGIKATSFWALVLEILTVGFALLFRDRLLFIPALLVLPLFVLGALKPNLSNVMRATKFSVLVLAVVVCFYFPWYFVPIFLVFFLSKWYYRKRFDFNYPSFKSS
ncbi:UbiA family prenyltransferase [bacterium]|nr:UbiA family prenyltransferase [bacterium]